MSQLLKCVCVFFFFTRFFKDDFFLALSDETTVRSDIFRPTSLLNPRRTLQQQHSSETKIVDALLVEETRNNAS